MSNVHKNSEYSLNERNRKVALIFVLCHFAGNILNRHAPACVHGDALRQASNFRRVKCADEIVVDVGLLGTVFAHALRLMYNNLFHKFIEDKRGKFLYIGVPLHRS